MKKINAFYAIFLAVLLFSSYSLTFFHLRDKTYSYNWYIFYGWLILFFLAIFIVIYGQFHIIFYKIGKFIKINKTPLFFILCFAVITRFLFLGQYPYPYMGDCIRDSGLYAMDIRSGNIKDIFGFGAYNGYGLFVPLISSYFLPIFPNSSYMFLVPAAFTSIIGILLLYVLCRQWYGKRIATIAAIFLISSPFNLHYSRYELLISLDAPIALLMIIATYSSTRFIGGYLLSGLIYGLAFHFYASLRGFALACFLYLFLYFFSVIARSLRRSNLSATWKTLLTQHILGIILVGSGMVISIGPTLNALTKDKVFTHAGTQTLLLSAKSFSTLSILKKISFVGDLYEKSLATYFINPTRDNRLKWKMPLLDFPLNWLFVLGVSYCIIKKKLTPSSMTMLLFIITLVVPLTNQALINDVSSEHRMQGILPIIYMFSAIGLLALIKKLPAKIQNAAFFIFLFIISFSRLHFYFTDRASEIDYFSDPKKEYILQAISEHIRDDKTATSYYIVNNAVYNYEYLHYQEKVKFYTFPKQVNIIEEQTALNEIVRAKKTGNTAFFYFTSPLTIPFSVRSENIQINCTKKSLLIQYNCPLIQSPSYGFTIITL